MEEHNLEITLLTPQVRDAASTLQEEFVVEAMKSCQEIHLAEEISLGIWRLWGSSFPCQDTHLCHQDAGQGSVTLPVLLAESHHPQGSAPAPGISQILTFPFENL